MAVTTRSMNGSVRSRHHEKVPTNVAGGHDDDQPHHQHHEWMVLYQIAKLLLCVFGIYGAYITQGVFQEMLATKKFDGERFPHLATLNSFQSWACFLWAFMLLSIQSLITKKGKNSSPHPPMMSFWKAGFTNCFGPACGFQALYYIPYPAQVLAKSSKMIPVMVMGTVLHGKRYSMIEYLCCLLVTAGVSMFAGWSSSKSTRNVAYPNAPLGYFLCLSNLVLDGYTNVAQDEINRKYKGNTPLHMMCWMNFWTGVFYLPLMFVLSTSGKEVLMFCWNHPAAGYDVLSFCLCGAVGQLFIFYTIKSFGSLTNTLVTTTRKFFSILASVVWSGNPLIWQQWVAVLLVFSGLITSSVTKHRRFSLQQHKRKHT